MNTSGETADQVVRMSLQGIEVAGNIAIKAGGAAAKSLAATLYAILTDKKKVKGRTRLDSLLKSGKELEVFAIRHEDLKKFCNEAKHYGVLYSVLKEKNNTDGICDIMVKVEDAPKITRIIERFELARIDSKTINDSIKKQENTLSKEAQILNDKEHDELIQSLMDSTNSTKENPSNARTEKQSDNPFERSLKKVNAEKDSTYNYRRSVRNDLDQIRKEQNQKHFPKKNKLKRKVK